MNSRRLLCATSGALLAPLVLIPESFAERASGLLGARSGGHPAMLFRYCTMIHMFGMRVPIDVVFLNDLGEVTKVLSSLQPWRMAWCRRAAHTLEMPSGSVSRLGIIKGRRLEIC